jgi:hypothetical protein
MFETLNTFGNFEILFDLRFIIYTDSGGNVKKEIGVFGIVWNIV